MLRVRGVHVCAAPDGGVIPSDPSALASRNLHGRFIKIDDFWNTDI